MTTLQVTIKASWPHTNGTHAQVEAAIVLLLVNLLVVRVALTLRLRPRFCAAVVLALCRRGAQLGVRMLLRDRTAALRRICHAVT